MRKRQIVEIRCTLSLSLSLSLSNWNAFLRLKFHSMSEVIRNDWIYSLAEMYLVVGCETMP